MILKDTSWSDGLSLAEARTVVNELMDQGVVCPCCLRLAKRYTRKMHHTMAAFATYVYRVHGSRRWFNMEKMTRRFLMKYPKAARPGDAAKLRFWGILERAPKENRAAPGTYMLTHKGERFALGDLLVPSYYVTYKDTVEEISDTTVDIHGALKTKFDYNELMGFDQ